ncbi:MAG TPA: tetratricopeptide repeat protein [Fimbriimonadales bacterium]|nr:tetratricopeptide repeat protein [Fimbriimonadales bacterium]
MDSITCPSCQTVNSRDSKFCKGCGEAVVLPPTPDVSDTEGALKEGYRLIHEGHSGEALVIAESILAKSPADAGAYILRAMCREQRGDLKSAIADYEEVVRLRPDSTLDRIKLDQLRRSDALTEVHKEERSRSRFAIFCAAGAAIAVAAIGVLMALPKASADDGSQQITENYGQARGFEFPAKNPVMKPDAPKDPNPITGAQQPTLPPASPNNSSRPTTRRNGSSPLGPLVVEFSPEDKAKLPKISKTNPGAASAEQTDAQTPDTTPEKPKPKGPGTIQISESQPSDPNEPAVSENTYRVAQNKMASGDYRGAIRDFSSALAASNRPALIHQLMGRCYARIGETANARQQFQAALAIYEKAGATNEARACRRELDLLG